MDTIAALYDAALMILAGVGVWALFSFGMPS